MTFSTQTHHGLRYVVEESYGVLPDPFSVSALRHSGCDLNLIRQSIESDEIRSDRQISHFFHGTEEVTGEIDFELCYGAFDDILAAALMADWESDQLESGTNLQSLLLERAFSDVDQYQQYHGCCVDRLDLTVQPESLVGGRLSVKGRRLSLSDNPLSESVSAPAYNAPMEAFKGSVSIDGVLQGLVAGLDLRIENGLENTYALGSRSAASALYGKSRISGELTAFFEDNSLFQKFLDQSHCSLSLTLIGEGGSYEITLPKILYMAGNNPVRGDKAVTTSFTFVALQDAVMGTDIRIERNAD